MSIVIFILGMGLGWFISNIVTAHQIAEMSTSEVDDLKKQVDYLVDNNHL